MRRKIFLFLALGFVAFVALFLICPPLVIAIVCSISGQNCFI